MRQVCSGLAALAAVCGGPVLAADAVRGDAGELADGTAVEAVTLSNASGVLARILTYGATLQTLPRPTATASRRTSRSAMTTRSPTRPIPTTSA